VGPSVGGTIKRRDVKKVKKWGAELLYPGDGGEVVDDWEMRKARLGPGPVERRPPIPTSTNLHELKCSWGKSNKRFG